MIHLDLPALLLSDLLTSPPEYQIDTRARFEASNLLLQGHRLDGICPFLKDSLLVVRNLLSAFAFVLARLRDLLAFLVARSKHLSCSEARLALIRSDLSS